MLKFVVFADYHFFPAGYPISSDGFDEIVEKAHRENADIILSCGDLMNDAVNEKEAMNKLYKNKYNIPFLTCYGNHELEGVDSLDALNKAHGYENSYFYRDIKNFRIIITDTNNYRDDEGNTVHYEGRSYGGACRGGKDTNALGDVQLKWLEKTIFSSPYPCIVLSHSGFEYDICSEDAKAVREMFEHINGLYPHRVLMSIYGHYHRNSIHKVGSVVHFDVNTSNVGEWRPTRHELFPEEFTQGHYMAKNCAFFKDPLSALVTAEENGHITVKGMKTDYVYGVSPEMFGGPFDAKPFGICEPFISDADIYL